MFRILIIEDDTNKLRNVLSKLNNISDLDVDSIEHSLMLWMQKENFVPSAMI